ncbi:hypothetical protein Sjap_011033 [Stephania japonica]|uniref:Uncharacterized protein n=1 Tax=Stephania japonica TaxID=461633 RepID=A0AAP0JCK8_9MAGN
MMPRQQGRDHVEATLQPGENEVVEEVLGFQATEDELPLAVPPITVPPQHLSSSSAENHQIVTIDQELIRLDSQTSTMNTLADDSYPFKSLNISNGAEKQHYTSNYDRIIDQNRNGLQLPSITTIQNQIGAGSLSSATSPTGPWCNRSLRTSVAQLELLGPGIEPPLLKYYELRD